VRATVAVLTQNLYSAYALLGKPFNYGPAEFKEDFVKSENEKLQPFTSGGILRHLLRNELIKGNKMKKMDGGLESVPQGMKYMEEGKVSRPLWSATHLLARSSQSRSRPRSCTTSSESGTRQTQSRRRCSCRHQAWARQ
jgi:hypothetical protein